MSLFKYTQQEEGVNKGKLDPCSLAPVVVLRIYFFKPTTIYHRSIYSWKRSMIGNKYINMYVVCTKKNTNLEIRSTAVNSPDQ
jgi:hypothetical protein